jgi:hypothetical protein
LAVEVQSVLEEFQFRRGPLRMKESGSGGWIQRNTWRYELVPLEFRFGTEGLLMQISGFGSGEASSSSAAITSTASCIASLRRILKHEWTDEEKERGRVITWGYMFARAESVDAVHRFFPVATVEAEIEALTTACGWFSDGESLERAKAAVGEQLLKTLDDQNARALQDEKAGYVDTRIRPWKLVSIERARALTASLARKLAHKRSGAAVTTTSLDQKTSADLIREFVKPTPYAEPGDSSSNPGDELISLGQVEAQARLVFHYGPYFVDQWPHG